MFFETQIKSNFLDGYAYRRPIIVDHTKVGDNHINFPVDVFLRPHNYDFTKSLSNGHDVRFTAADGITPLFFERERHDPAIGRAEYKVRIPHISNIIPSKFYIYFRNKPTADGSNPAAVWDANTIARYSMSENPAGIAPQIRDSTVFANHGTTHGTMTAGQSVEGRIGRALNFDGINDFVNVPDSPSLSIRKDLTITAWVFSNTTMTGSIVSKHHNAEYDFVFWSNRLWFYHGPDWKLSHVISDTILPINTWHFIAVTRRQLADGRLEVKLYINSAPDKSGTFTQVPPDTTNPVTIGRRPFPSTHFFNGFIDEVHISNIARSPAWVRASFESGNGTLISIGAEETQKLTTKNKLNFL